MPRSLDFARMSGSTQERAIVGYLANAMLFTAAILVYHYNQYYQDFLREDTLTLLTWLYGAYMVFGIPLALFSDGQESKGLLALRAAGRFMTQGLSYLSRFPLDRERAPRITQTEKTAMLFLAVKFFFLPIMLNYLFQNGHATVDNWNNLSTFADVQKLLLEGWYALLLSLIFFIDTFFFAFGYVVEHPALKNTVRSVEPTFFGWLVAIICYPPFNDVPGYYVGWAADDYAIFDSVQMTFALRIAVLLCLFVYVWATIALGAKCSNLTNRGIVSRGPYAYVRHPAYISKNLAWWLTSVPFIMNTGRVSFAVMSMGLWSLIYFFRALTEERHLIADPDYQEYCRRVKWRFIPYVW